ncbi:GerMN domain-containing protein [Salsuginibacillus kocurii]|uniref:GerMN domain-containing protein n=1 Tax=Salsuginibacillus kocurii TaxID=427078 RepID=UPI00035F1EA9|nr:GerMN domain-containing protein [Salsuginibacillus kocurii]
MRNKDEHTNEELETRLQNLPRIEDQRSKEEVYHQIEQRMAKEPKRFSANKKQRPTWLVPLFTTTAAALLLLVIVPGLLFDGGENQQSADYDTESMPPGEEEGDEAEDMPVEEDAVEEEESEEEEAPEEDEAVTDDAETFEAVEEDMEDNEAEEAVEEDEEAETSVIPEEPADHLAAYSAVEEEGEPITLMLTEPNAQFVVPITYTLANEESTWEALGALNAQMSGEEYGLSSSPLANVEFIEENGEAILRFDEQPVEMSSTETTLFVAAVEESLRYAHYDRVQLETSAGEPVELGALGLTEELESSPEQATYTAYETPDGFWYLLNEQTLAEGKSAPESFSDALQAMSEPKEEESLQNPLPSEVTYESEDIEENAVRVTIEEEFEELGENREQVMRDAILLTASSFGYQTVEFSGQEEHEGIEGEHEVKEAPSYVGPFEF